MDSPGVPNRPSFSCGVPIARSAKSGPPATGIEVPGAQPGPECIERLSQDRLLLRPCEDRQVIDPVVDAATCNASWCDAVCRTLALPTRWGDDAWTAFSVRPTVIPTQ